MTQVFAALLIAGLLAQAPRSGALLALVLEKEGDWFVNEVVVNRGAGLTSGAVVQLKSTTGTLRVLMPNGTTKECRKGTGSDCVSLTVPVIEPEGIWQALSRALHTLIGSDATQTVKHQSKIERGASRTVQFVILDPSVTNLRMRDACGFTAADVRSFDVSITPDAAVSPARDVKGIRAADNFRERLGSLAVGTYRADVFAADDITVICSVGVTVLDDKTSMKDVRSSLTDAQHALTVAAVPADLRNEWLLGLARQLLADIRRLAGR